MTFKLEITPVLYPKHGCFSWKLVHPTGLFIANERAYVSEAAARCAAKEVIDSMNIKYYEEI